MMLLKGVDLGLKQLVSYNAVYMIRVRGFACAPLTRQDAMVADLRGQSPPND